MFGAAAAAGISIGRTAPVFAQASGPDDWIKEVKGTHRNLFDFPQHKYFFPQLHILNYINTYNQGYKAAAGTRNSRISCPRALKLFTDGPVPELCTLVVPQNMGCR